MNISVVAIIFWCTDLYNQCVVGGLTVLFVSLSSVQATVSPIAQYKPTEEESRNVCYRLFTR
jgi:hypothetical protein